jgi:Fur family peroxide stress response transcriptional regulator
MNDPRERFEGMKAKLQQRSYRLTPQRIALLQLLASSDGHPSAAELHEELKKQFPTTSLATVYKTISVLKELGEVLELNFSEYNNRYDGRDPSPHPHLICIRCRKVVDPKLRTVQRLEREAADASGYRIVGHRIDFYGICPGCAKEE